MSEFEFTDDAESPRRETPLGTGRGWQMSEIGLRITRSPEAETPLGTEGVG